MNDRNTESDTPSNSPASGNAPEETSLNFTSILNSTLAAAFGVQSAKNRERDFQKGNIWVFIAAGTIFTFIFVLSVLALVRWVLSGS